MQVEDQGHELVTPPVPPSGDRQGVYTAPYARSLGQAADPVENEGRDARLTVRTAQPSFTIIVYNLNGTLRHDAQAEEPTVDVLQRPSLDRSGLGEALVSNDRAGSSEPYWSHPQAAYPHVVSRTGGPVAVTWRGDFTLEAVGIAGDVTTADRGWSFESGRWETPLADGQPAQENAHAVREVFLRVRVEDGVLSFSAPDASAAWSGPSLLSTYLDGVATLESATGMVSAADGQAVRVSSPRLALAGPQGLASRPEGSGLDVDLVPVDAQGRPLPEAAVALAAPAAVLEGILAGTAVLAIGLSITYVVYRRYMRRLPILADVEAALEANAFRRAAREARRILHRRPDSEDAMLSRAIALSKSGRHRAVAREVRHHLQARRPTDGVLHYVLGVAQQELGRLEEARASFEEAVRRTPALLKDVQERLGGAAPSRTAPPVRSPSPPEPRDASGYA